MGSIITLATSLAATACCEESTNLDLQTQVPLEDVSHCCGKVCFCGKALWALHRFSEGTPKQTKCMVEQAGCLAISL